MRLLDNVSDVNDLIQKINKKAFYVEIILFIEGFFLFDVNLRTKILLHQPNILQIILEILFVFLLLG